MMKEIRFRGKTLNGDFVYGDLIHKDDKIFIDGHLVLPDSVSQFVDWDDNGESIYEGDKVYRPSYCKDTGIEWMDTDCDYIVGKLKAVYITETGINDSRPHHLYLRKKE